MKHVLWLAAIAVLAAAASNAQSAKPENPSAFAAQVVVPDAKTGGAGDTVPNTAKSSPGALADAISGAKDFLGSSPNPTGRN